MARSRIFRSATRASTCPIAATTCEREPMLKALLARAHQGHRTMAYPAGAPPPMPERFRGLPALDPAKCPEGCRSCADVCPTDANYSAVAATTDNGVSIALATPTVAVSDNASSSLKTGGTLIFSATVTGPTGGTTPSGTGTWTITGGASSCSSSTPAAGGANVATYTWSITSVKAASTYSGSCALAADANYRAVAATTDNGVARAMDTPLSVVAVSDNASSSLK